VAQNIYDTPDFFAAYGKLPRSVRGLEGAPEWPAIRALLPDLAGRRIVDLGCGFGWFCRFAAEHGAASVLGLDLSENMLARARADTTDTAIEYRLCDLDQLVLPEAAFDLAYSSLALHYVVDFGRLVRTVHRAVLPGGRFVFTIEHPIYMAPRQPGFVETADGGLRWPVDSYAIEGERTTDWLAKGVVKQHRTMGTTVNTLIDAGFRLRHLEEFRPTAEQVAADPDLREELERPMFVIIAADR